MNFSENFFNNSDNFIFPILLTAALLSLFLLILLNRKKTARLQNTLELLTLMKEEKITAARNQSRMGDILENTSDLVCMSNLKQDIIYTNRQSVSSLPGSGTTFTLRLPL